VAFRRTQAGRLFVAVLSFPGAKKIGGSGEGGSSPHLRFWRKFAHTPHQISGGNTPLVRISVEGKKVGTIQPDKIMQLSQQSFRGLHPTRSPCPRLAERTGSLAERDIGRMAVERKAVDRIERNLDPRTVRRITGYNLEPAPYRQTQRDIRPNTLKVVKSSGHTLIDEGAPYIVRSSAPFAPPPQELTFRIDIAISAKH